MCSNKTNVHELARIAPVSIDPLINDPLKFVSTSVHNGMAFCWKFTCSVGRWNISPSALRLLSNIHFFSLDKPLSRIWRRFQPRRCCNARYGLTWRVVPSPTCLLYDAVRSVGCLPKMYIKVRMPYHHPIWYVHSQHPEQALQFTFCSILGSVSNASLAIFKLSVPSLSISSSTGPLTLGYLNQSVNLGKDVISYEGSPTRASHPVLWTRNFNIPGPVLLLLNILRKAER